MLDKRVFWRPLLISPNSSIRKPLIEGLCKRLPPSEHTVLSEYQSADRVLELVSTMNANLCLVDVSTDECRALALVRELTAKELTVVVLHTSDDSGLILRCLRCGAHEFLFPPFETGSTWAVLDELAARRCSQSGRALGSVYVVLPSKPNIGSTTVATSLAVRAVEEHGKPILLADLDPLYGSVQFLLKTKGNFTFIDAFST